MKMKLEYYGGNGFESIHCSEGKFTIKHGEDKETKFTQLHEARNFYDSIVKGILSNS